MSEYVLGLDGGGTRTLAALAQRTGDLCEVWRTSGINPFDRPDYGEILEDLLSHVPRREVAYAVLGLPGYGEVEEVSRTLEALVRRLLESVPLCVLNDVQVAYYGAFLDEDGVLLLAGTGSMAWAKKGHEQVRVGGWGEFIGDEGSAYWIGTEALRRLTWALDGRIEDRGFLTTMLDALQAADGSGVLRWRYHLTHPRSEVAQLSQRVDELAEARSPTALSILDHAAQLLAHQALTAARRLHMQPFALRLSGGVFRSRTVRERVIQLLPDALLQETILPPVGGALWMAARRAGWNPTDQWVRNLRTALLREGIT
jgi:glucosamine kinase